MQLCSTTFTLGFPEDEKRETDVWTQFFTAFMYAAEAPAAVRQRALYIAKWIDQRYAESKFGSQSANGMSSSHSTSSHSPFRVLSVASGHS